MSRLCAADALCESVLRVSAESRITEIKPETLTANTTHLAVFEGGKFLGVIRLGGTSSAFSQRIFVDLLPKAPGPQVSAETSLDDIDPLMTISEAVSVVDGSGTFLGIVTTQSLLNCLLKETQKQQNEQKRLKLAAEQDRDQARRSLEGYHRLLDTICHTQSQLINSKDPQPFYERLLQHLLSLSNSAYGFIGDVLQTQEGRPI